ADDVAALQAAVADPAITVGARAQAHTTLAWYLRQRDTHAACDHARRAGDAAEPHQQARLTLARAEAAYLFTRIDEALRELERAHAAFAAIGDEIGLGDCELLRAMLRDHVGGDRLGAMQAAHAHYQRAGDALRTLLAAGCAACLQATSQPDDAEARW